MGKEINDTNNSQRMICDPWPATNTSIQDYLCFSSTCHPVQSAALDNPHLIKVHWYGFEAFREAFRDMNHRQSPALTLTTSAEYKQKTTQRSCFVFSVMQLWELIISAVCRSHGMLWALHTSENRSCSLSTHLVLCFCFEVWFDTVLRFFANFLERARNMLWEQGLRDIAKWCSSL